MMYFQIFELFIHEHEWANQHTLTYNRRVWEGGPELSRFEEKLTGVGRNGEKGRRNQGKMEKHAKKLRKNGKIKLQNHYSVFKNNHCLLFDKDLEPFLKIFDATQLKFQKNF